MQNYNVTEHFALPLGIESYISSRGGNQEKVNNALSALNTHAPLQLLPGLEDTSIEVLHLPLGTRKEHVDLLIATGSLSTGHIHPFSQGNPTLFKNKEVPQVKKYVLSPDENVGSIIKNVKTLAALHTERPDFYFPNGYFRIALADILGFRLPTDAEIMKIIQRIPGDTIDDKMTHIGRLHIPGWKKSNFQFLGAAHSKWGYGGIAIKSEGIEKDWAEPRHHSFSFLVRDKKNI